MEYASNIKKGLFYIYFLPVLILLAPIVKHKVNNVSIFLSILLLTLYIVYNFFKLRLSSVKLEEDIISFCFRSLAKKSKIEYLNKNDIYIKISEQVVSNGITKRIVVEFIDNFGKVKYKLIEDRNGWEKKLLLELFDGLKNRIKSENILSQ